VPGLAGKVAVVTGATQTMGAAIAGGWRLTALTSSASGARPNAATRSRQS